MFHGEIATAAFSQPLCVNCLSDGRVLPLEGFYLPETVAEQTLLHFQVKKNAIATRVRNAWQTLVVLISLQICRDSKPHATVICPFASQLQFSNHTQLWVPLITFIFLN